MNVATIVGSSLPALSFAVLVSSDALPQAAPRHLASRQVAPSIGRSCHMLFVIPRSSVQAVSPSNPDPTTLMNTKTESMKVALVTGASSGIGQATAERLAGAGYTVYGTSRRGGDASERSFAMLSLDVTASVVEPAYINTPFDANLMKPCLLYTSPSPRD